MTIGIYMLSFTGTTKVYIGQSGNCELRYLQHINKLKKGTAARKLQHAYSIYGKPEFSQLCSCSMSELDEQERSYISKYNSYLEGFNSTEGGDSTPVLNGLDNPNAKYTEEDYWNVLYFLGIPGYSWNQISELTGVSKYVVSHISSGESHNWLADKYPEEYALVEDIRESGIGRMSAFMQGIVYPTILSPEGGEYQVEHCTNFAKEHGLSQPKLSEVLNGKRIQHKGWRLKDSLLKTYPRIKDPNNVEYEVPFHGAAEFAKTHNLTHSNLHRLLTYKANSHKGWTRV